jgi:hypothetical protein
VTVTDQTDRDVSWSVVFRLDDNDDWHDWTRNHRDVADAVKSAETLVKTPPVVEIRFDRITVQRERFSLAELSAAQDAASFAGRAPAADRAAVEQAFVERLAAELAGCCTECDACIEIAQHMAGKAQEGTTAKLPQMDPVHILGIGADTSVARPGQPETASETPHTGEGA